MAYTSKTKIGNWVEDRSLEEERREKFSAAQSSGELSFLKTQTARAAATASVALAAASPGTLSVEDTVQLIHEPTAAALSTLDGEENVEVTAALDGTAPSLRNAFVVEAMDGSPRGSPVVYGGKVALRCIGGATRYLASDRAGPHTQVAHFSGEQKVMLADVEEGGKVPYQAAWVVDCFDASVRPETQGQAVPTGTVVLLRHAGSNEALCCHADQRKRYLTKFGPEVEVSAGTKKAGSVMGEPVMKTANAWMFKVE